MSIIKDGKQLHWNFELISQDKNHLPWFFPKTKSIETTINKKKINANIILTYEAGKLIKLDITKG